MLSRSAGCVFIIKPDQRTRIRTRHGLTHSGCWRVPRVKMWHMLQTCAKWTCHAGDVTETCGGKRVCWRDERGQRPGSIFPNMLLVDQRKNGNQSSIFCIDHSCENILAFAPLPSDFSLRKGTVYVPLYRITVIVKLWPWLLSDWPEGSCVTYLSCAHCLSSSLPRLSE